MGHWNLWCTKFWYRSWFLKLFIFVHKRKLPLNIQGSDVLLNDVNHSSFFPWCLLECVYTYEHFLVVQELLITISTSIMLYIMASYYRWSEFVQETDGHMANYHDECTWFHSSLILAAKILSNLRSVLILWGKSICKYCFISIGCDL